MNFRNFDINCSYKNIGRITLYRETRTFCEVWILKTQRLSTGETLIGWTYCRLCLYLILHGVSGIAVQVCTASLLTNTVDMFFPTVLRSFLFLTKIPRWGNVAYRNILQRTLLQLYIAAQTALAIFCLMCLPST